MFKYNQKFIVPFVALFIVYLLFLFINKKNLTYNHIPEIIKEPNINSCNREKKNLDVKTTLKTNNSKIMNYVFENLQIQEKFSNMKIGDSLSDMTIQGETYEILKKITQKHNQKVIEKNILDKQNLKNKIKGEENNIINIERQINSKNQELGLAIKYPSAREEKSECESKTLDIEYVKNYIPEKDRKLYSGDKKCLPLKNDDSDNLNKWRKCNMDLGYDFAWCNTEESIGGKKPKWAYCNPECSKVSSNKDLNYFEDKNQYCNDWAEKGECEKNPNYMKSNCPMSCNNSKQ